MTQGPAPDDDDDRTVIRVSTVKSGEGGADSRFAASSGFMGHTLPEGTRLEGFEIIGLIGEGGFGIVYLAYDPALERKVAIKEYMPSSLASRGTTTFEVAVKSERHRETFEAGLKSFVNEARLLARFDHPALVKVFRFWEANRTAYMAMPYYEGPTLKRALAELGAPPSEALLREWLRPLLDALSVMHKEQCFHRDIAPDNILLTERGPLLLDFGAARRVIGDMTHALTVVLKPGYAPIEQYGEAASMMQGPWTDLYALASVVHYAITGRAPITSVERIMGDALEPLAATAAGRYSDGFLRAIDAALAVRPKDRPQDVQQFRDLLNAGLAPDSPDRFLASGFQSSGFHTSGFSPSSFDPALLEPTPARTAPPSRRSEPVTAMPAMATRDEPPAAAGAGSGFGKSAYVAVAFALLAVAALVLYMRGRAVEAPAIEPAPALSAPVVAAPVASEPPAVAPAPSAPVVTVAPAVEAPLPTPTPTPTPELTPAPAQTPAPAPSAVPLEPAMPPTQSPVTPPGAVAAPVPVERRPDPPVRAVPPRQAPRPAAVVEPAPPRSAGVRPARCSDILQKASLEPLTPEEAAYLRRECR